MSVESFTLPGVGEVDRLRARLRETAEELASVAQLAIDLAEDRDFLKKVLAEAEQTITTQERQIEDLLSRNDLLECRLAEFRGSL